MKTVMTVKVLWSEKCVAVDHNFKVMLKSTSDIKVSLAEGCALNITKPQKRFSVRVKEFLHSIYKCMPTAIQLGRDLTLTW